MRVVWVKLNRLMILESLMTIRLFQNGADEKRGPVHGAPKGAAAGHPR